MNDVRIESFDLNGCQIKTTVIDIRNKIVVDEHISSFLRSAYENGNKVIGFDIQFSVSDDFQNECHFRSRCANLNFCVGHSCLIILLSGNYFHRFLPLPLMHNFLSMPDYTFVGVGIKDKLVKLEKQCGIGYINAFELGPLAATVMDMPRLSFCGLDELAFVVNGIDLREQRPLSLDFNWGSKSLSIELLKLATVNVYSYYKIGSTLL